jgi:hypothetical protein
LLSDHFYVNDNKGNIIMNGTNYVNYGGTVGTSAQQAAPVNTTTLNYSTLILQNQSTNGNFLYYTLDGSAPVAGASNTFALGPASTTSAGQGYISMLYPNAGINVIGSAAGTVYACNAG